MRGRFPGSKLRSDLRTHLANRITRGGSMGKTRRLHFMTSVRVVNSRISAQSQISIPTVIIIVLGTDDVQ